MQMRANRFLLFIGNGERINKRCVATGVYRSRPTAEGQRKNEMPREAQIRGNKKKTLIEEHVMEVCAENEACGWKCVLIFYVLGRQEFWLQQCTNLKAPQFDPASVVNVHIAETGLLLQLPVSVCTCKRALS